MRCRPIFLLALFWVLPAAPSAFAGDGTEKAQLDQIADAIQYYIANDDDASFDEMMDVLPVTIDPWMVAYTLVGRGQFEPAREYAGRVSGTDGKKLQASLETLSSTLARDAKAILDAYLDGRPREVALKDLDATSGGGHAFLEAALRVFRGFVLVELKAWEKAEAAFDEGIELTENVGWFAGTIKSLRTASLCARVLQKPRANLDLLTRLNKHFEDARWDLEAAVTLCDVGLAHADIGDFAGATARCKTAVRALRPMGGVDYSDALSNFGSVLSRAGDYAQALTVLEEAIALVEDKASTAVILNEMASARSRLEHHSDAKKLIEEASVLATQALTEVHGKQRSTRKHKRILANIAGDCGSIYSRAGELEISESAAIRAGKLYTLLKDVRGVAYVKILRAANARLSNKPADALRLAEEARDELTAIEDLYGVAAALDEISEVQLITGAREEVPYARAVATIERILELDVAPLLRAQALTRLARVELKRKRPRAALGPALEAVDLVATSLVGVGSLYGAMARDARAQTFETAMRVCARLGKHEHALKVIEAGRAGDFFLSLDGRDRLREAEIGPVLSKELDEARTAAARARTALLEAKRTGRLATIRKAKEQLDAKRSTFATLVEKTQRSRKAAAGVLFPPKTATLKQLSAQLKPGDAMLLFAFFADRAFAMSLTKDHPKDTGVVLIRPRETAKIRAALADLDIIESKSDPKATAELRKLLGLEELTPKGAKRLILSVNGPLTGVPFSVLTDLEVSYVPSATTYRFLSTNRAPAGSQVLALGDPAYGTHDTTDAFVPTDLRASTDRGRLGPLPHTKDEVLKVGDVHLIGKNATEGELRKHLEQGWRAVHLACHGLVDRERPMYSALALTSPKEADDVPTDQDGFLTSHEIFELEIKADLVVLSACETALGRFYRGEGVHGLPRALIYAGSPRVIVSLWRVDDAATSVLMKKFHSLWNPHDKKTKPLSTGAALKAAQAYVRDYEIEVDEEGGKKKMKPWAHPKYWAAWQLWGLPD